MTITKDDICRRSMHTKSTWVSSDTASHPGPYTTCQHHDPAHQATQNHMLTMSRAQESYPLPKSCAGAAAPSHSAAGGASTASQPPSAGAAAAGAAGSGAAPQSAVGASAAAQSPPAPSAGAASPAGADSSHDASAPTPAQTIVSSVMPICLHHSCTATTAPQVSENKSMAIYAS